MADEVLKGIAQTIVESQERIDEAQSYIEAMRAAGEPVTERQAELNQLKIRVKKWQDMLRDRGITAE